LPTKFVMITTVILAESFGLKLLHPTTIHGTLPTSMSTAYRRLVVSVVQAFSFPILIDLYIYISCCQQAVAKFAKITNLIHNLLGRIAF